MATNSEKYVKLSQREHVLQRPDTYIGSTTNELKELQIITDSENLKIKPKLINFNSGFYKIYDEILTNASDHAIRTGKVKYIKIIVDGDHISIENDGPGIPIEIHEKEKIYIPEMLFGSLLTSENYNDSEERFVGGRNGYGSKLTNIFSTKFIVETADGKNYYKQIFLNNLEKINKPEIKKSKDSFTKITFYPDFQKFNLECITDEIEKIFLKRALDVSAYCPKVKVYFNDEELQIKSFKDYIALYTDNDILYEKINNEWEFGVALSSNDNFQQVSIVNGISTYVGGTHVNHILNQIVKGVKEQLEKKNKKINIKANDIKNKIFLFLNCKIPNPTFDTQTKENLTSKLTDLVKTVVVSDKFIKQIIGSQIVEDILNYIELRESAELKKLNKGKTNKVKVKKLDDANMAGTASSDLAYLFICEGDSAVATVKAGFSSVGRDYYGSLPLKGKPLNVKDLPISKIKENDEIKSIVTALGLEFGKKYTSTKELRYGKLVIMADADADALHIKGLLINIFQEFWPELLNMDFLYDFITPIMKVEKGKTVKYFYKLNEYNEWKNNSDIKGYEFTYYKGLGTIIPEEAKMFFKNIKKHLIKFEQTEKETISECVDLAFNKKRAEDRKDWLTKYEEVIVDKFAEPTTYDSFFNKEFINFSMYDNIRSIPNIMDGLKPSQRKIIYTLFKRTFKSKIKVSLLSGAVTEESAYHHGNVSLEGTVVGLAQNYVGSNNINLLEPLGQFGTRLKGGSDAASARYIFTELNSLTRSIFKSEDDKILDYLDDDGYPIEPKYYVPIIPMVLVNGADGIGTGWSTSVPKYNPKDIITWIKNKLTNKSNKEIEPYYQGFKGKIIFDEENNRWVSKGIIKKVNQTTVRITELPIGCWNDKYYDTLDKLIENKIIKDYTKNDTDVNVDITVTLSKESLTEIEDKGNAHKVFSLESYISTSNLILFDENCKIRKYESITEILNSFYTERFKWYFKRKEYILSKLEADRKLLLNRMKFINHLLKETLKVNNVKREIVETKLVELEIDKINGNFDYLLNMPIHSLTNEKLIELKSQYEKKKEEIDKIRETSLEQMWFNDLKEIEKYV